MKKKLLILFTFAALVFPSTVFAATKSGGYVIRNDSLHGQYPHLMSLIILQQKKYLEEMLNGDINTP